MTNDFDEIRKQARLLLTLMMRLKEFDYQDKENDKCVLTNKMMPVWTSALIALDQLIYMTENPNYYE